MKEKIITKDDIVETLREIKKSIKNDVGTIIDLYIDHFFKTDEDIGLFAVPRLLFPEIDNMGSYFVGENLKNSPDNAIKFMKKYFSKVDIEYKNKSAFIYIIYRHGLMHQHIPKFMSYRRKNIGWAIGLSKKNTISHHLKLMGKTIRIDGRQFYEDFLDAIDFYIDDIKRGDKKIFNNFIKAHTEMMKPLSKSEYLKNKSYVKQKDFNFLK